MHQKNYIGGVGNLGMIFMSVDWLVIDLTKTRNPGMGGYLYVSRLTSYRSDQDQQSGGYLSYFPLHLVYWFENLLTFFLYINSTTSLPLPLIYNNMPAPIFTDPNTTLYCAHDISIFIKKVDTFFSLLNSWSSG